MSWRSWNSLINKSSIAVMFAVCLTGCKQQEISFNVIVLPHDKTPMFDIWVDGILKHPEVGDGGSTGGYDDITPGAHIVQEKGYPGSTTTPGATDISKYIVTFDESTCHADGHP